MRKSLQVALVLAVSGGLLAAPSASSAAQPDAPPGGISGSITLITGDKVELGPGQAPRITRGPGREAIPLRINKNNDRWTVLPLDAAKLVIDGKLDPRLFDVTTLLEWGYGDDKKPSTPLIVEGAVNGLAATGQQLPSIGASVVEASKKDNTFWKSLTSDQKAAGTGKVWVNGTRKPTLDKSTAQIGAPSAWQHGLTGKGVEVAVLDSGIDPTHPDVKDKIVAVKNFVGGPDDDRVGHGTHVASIIGGTGKASDGKYKGVAPDVSLSSGKVCVNYGCSEAAIIAGLEWAATERKAPVVNLSVGGPDATGIDPTEAAINRLSAQYGTLFVVAAGNSGGAGRSTVESPASATAALAVGAVDRTDATADFSSRGPRVGDSGLKPDVSAPGVEIMAAQGAYSPPWNPPGPYVAYSGTSMAAPHVAGAAAILRQQHPDWTGERLKAALMNTAKPGDDVYAQGAGRVDVAKATTTTLAASPASVDFGRAQWPHTDDEVLTKPVTYRNDGDNPVELTLSPLTGPFRLSAAKVTVPAHGTAEVTVSADTRPGEVAIGTHGARLIATADGVALSTPIGVEKEDERYEVKLNHISRDGTGNAEHITYVDRLGACADTACGEAARGFTGTDAVRVPPGQYTVTEFSIAKPGAVPDVLYRSLVEVKGNTVVPLDARLAQPVTVSAPHPTAKLVSSEIFVVRDFLRPGASGGVGLTGDADHVYRMADLNGPRPPAEQVYAQAYARFAEPGPRGDFADSPYEYNVVTSQRGRGFTGLDFRPKQAEFASVRTEVAKFHPEAASHHLVPVPETDIAPKWFLRFPNTQSPTPAYTTLPGRRTAYFLAAGTGWGAYSQESKPDGTFVHGSGSDAKHYQAGRDYQENWDKGVFGPRFRGVPFERPPFHQGVQRTGDRLTMGIDMVTDNDPAHWGNLIEQDRGSARLLRDGELVAEWADSAAIGVAADLPAAEASYRLERTVKYPESPVSSEVSVAWTFRSSHTDKSVPAPAMVVGYTPELDGTNHARPGGFAIPVTVQRQPGAAASPVKSLRVQVSYDEGRTWKPTVAFPAGDRWLALADNPAGGSVSLRTTAVDAAGNKVEQTTIKAYLVR
ncbi:S8 family serine peptidase [Amycolatopsis sp. NPDC059657]|uniref:S8 family peptidase n=1 Tax=Amycolatopsis sp. NPDC059657 TaxID=3346899 RepID=UPI0036711AAA